MIFLSTLSLRRATRNTIHSLQKFTISIHALLAESDADALLACVCVGISIHALLAESDFDEIQINAGLLLFLSTLSLRRATLLGALSLVGLHISIHALLAESDSGRPVRGL